MSTVAFSHQVLKESSHWFKKKAFQFTPVSSSFICASRTDIYVCMYMDVRKYIWILYIYIYTFRIALQVHLKCQNISIHQLPAFFHTFQPHSHAPSKEHWTTTWSRDVAARSMAQSQPVETTSKYIYIYIQYIDIYMEIFAYINVGIHFNKVSCKLCLLYECWNAEYQALHSICNIHTVHIKHYSRIYKICGTNQPFWKPHQRGGCN